MIYLAWRILSVVLCVCSILFLHFIPPVLTDDMPSEEIGETHPVPYSILPLPYFFTTQMVKSPPPQLPEKDDALTV